MKLRSVFLLIILISTNAPVLLAQADSVDVENDAREYTRLVMQHDQLLFEFKTGRPEAGPRVVTG